MPTTSAGLFRDFLAFFSLSTYLQVFFESFLDAPFGFLRQKDLRTKSSAELHLTTSVLATHLKA
jgi:hypothetical protein